MSIIYTFKNFWRKNSPIFKWKISGINPESPLLRPIDPWKGSLSNGEKSFISHPKIISNEYWHSFEWLRDLREVPNERARIRCRDLFNEWQSTNHEWDGRTWTTELLGKRLSNILFCYGTFADTAQTDFQEKLMHSFAAQARCLELDWKKINNYKEKMYALLGMMAGRICLTTVKEEIDDIIEKVIEETDNISNVDGMHISRKPHIHFEILKIIIEIQYLGKSSSIQYREKYDQIINKVTSCSKMLQNTDGSVVNFNGGSKFSKDLISQLISKSSSTIKPYNGITNDGFARMNLKSTSIFFDAGNPNNNSENWHAGTLAFELSYRKNLIVVNNGFMETETKWTKALRGTSAHSTISIDGKNSSNLDSYKNEGRIARTTNKIFKRTKDGFFASALHNGYFVSHGIYHKREIMLHDHGNKITGRDELIYSGAPGTIPLEAELRFHLSPYLKPAMVLSGDILLRLKNGSGWSFKTNGNSVSLQESIFVNQLNILKSKQIYINLSLKNLRSSGNKVIQWEFYKNS